MDKKAQACLDVMETVSKLVQKQKDVFAHCVDQLIDKYHLLQMEVGVEEEEMQSITDWMLVQCAMHAPVPPSTATERDVNELANVLCLWRVLGAQHTPELFRSSVTYKQFSEAWERTKPVLRACLMDGPGALVKAFADKIKQPVLDVNIQNMMTAMKKRCVDLRNQQSEMLQRLGLKSLLEQNEEEEEKKKLAGINSQVYKEGTMFLMDLASCAHSFVSLVSRVCFELAVGFKLESSYTRCTMNVDPSIETRMMAWIGECFRYDFGDDFESGYRKLCFEMVLPLGSRVKPLRNKFTESDKPASQTLLNSEVGGEVGRALRDLCVCDYKVVLNDRSHLFHDADRKSVV